MLGAAGDRAVRGRDRIAVRTGRRVAEEFVDARLEILGDDVLEPLRLLVDLVPLVAERLHQVALQQAVVADHLQGDLLAALGQAHAPVGHVGDEF